LTTVPSVQRPTDGTVQRLAGPAVLTFCIILLLHFAVAEPYHVPTGSMAPALLGRHTRVVCPRCGFENTLGCARGGECQCGPCQNCGLLDVALAKPAAMVEGDQILVNKSALWFQLPKRWEIIVFRLLGRDFIKRIVGLPGEIVAILGGDIYINGELQRKSFVDSKRLRVPVFDNNKQPALHGWRARWQVDGPAPCEVAARLTINAVGCSEYTTLKYQHVDLDALKCRPIVDEYAYNGRRSFAAETVHDFTVEFDLEATGDGALLIGVTDGGDELAVELPTNLSTARLLTNREVAGKTFAMPRSLARRANHHVELALVDRRFTLVIDGAVVASVDLPPKKERAGVTSPFWFGAKGARLRMDNVRLYRDIHYTQVGRNGVNGKAVQMGVDQYFVLGDNSANSEDSRFWANDGAVSAGSLIGKPVAMHFAYPGWIANGGRKRVPFVGTYSGHQSAGATQRAAYHGASCGADNACLDCAAGQGAAGTEGQRSRDH